MELVLSHITKKFGNKTALDDVTLKLTPYALNVFAGENGAGKSTLVKIIDGSLSLTSGKVEFSEGQKVVTVNQTPLVAESITVKENILLGLKSSEQNENKLKMLAQKWAPELSLGMRVCDIGGGERFYTSLLSCLMKEYDILLLDEPGAYLEEEERKKLFNNLSELKKLKTIVLITHDKKELAYYADNIFLLQKGKLLKTYTELNLKSNEYKDKIVKEIEKEIIGDRTDFIYLKNDDVKIENSSECSFTVKNLFCAPVDKPLIDDISFTVKAGELLVIKGLAEAGLLTLEDCITGMHECRAEFVFSKDKKTLATEKINPRFLRYTLKKKTGLTISVVPSDKTMRGSNPELTVSEMLYSASAENFSEEYIQDVIKNTGLLISSAQKVKSLSGGMLQRLMLERELYFNPDILIMCEPLAGLDMNKTKIIINRLVELKSQGKIIIILTTQNIPEQVCDKYLKLEGGKIC
ncbi:MAG: ATP-binding cassette domain-containing protein [Treponema sp.]|nr:ATP-binding cassette domain-containing protein [Treponema sp.]